jgi:hypothetical protein
VLLFSILSLFCLFIIFLLLALILPVKIFVKAAAGKEEDGWLRCRVMLYNGFTGIGIFTGKNALKLSFWIMNKMLLEFEIKTISSNFIKKIKKQKTEVTEKVKTPLIEKLKFILSKLKLLKKHFGLIKIFFREILIFKNLSADVRLSLTDPATTGIAGGLILAVNGILPHPWSVKPIWDFTGKGFYINIDARAKIVMIKLWSFAIYKLPPVIKDFRSGARDNKDINVENKNDKTEKIQEVN